MTHPQTEHEPTGIRSAVTKQRVRITWTVTADCYPEDRAALLNDADGLMFDGLVGGYATDATVAVVKEEIVAVEEE